jgi:hypothetical protein
VPQAVWPSRPWVAKWKETLLLANIKTCVVNTYNKAM